MAPKKFRLSDIAKLANVSIGTVDRAMHNRGRVSDATRAHVLRIAKQLGYKPDLAARALSTGGRSVSIGVCIPREIRYYFDDLRDGILDEARQFEHLGVTVRYRPIERLGVDEKRAFTAMMERGHRGIIVSPGNPDALTPLINEAEQRDIRVICVDTDAPSSRRSSAVWVEPVTVGNLAAEMLGGFLHPGSQVAIVTGTLQTEDHRKRTEGFREAFREACPSGTIVEVVEDHDLEEQALQKCGRLLKQHPNLCGIYVSTANCLPVCRAVAGAGRLGRVKLVTSDVFPAMEPHFESGLIAASIHAQPFGQGRMAVRLLIENLLHGRRLPRQYYLAPQVVTRSTFHLFSDAQNVRTQQVAVSPARAATSNFN